MTEEIDFQTLETMILNEVDNPYEATVLSNKKFRTKEKEEKEKDPLDLRPNRDIFKESLYEAIKELKLEKPEKDKSVQKTTG